LIANENRAQARAAALPSLSALNQFIYTQGNGTPSGVFVANDGVHVYNEQAVVHQELLSLVRRGEIRAAAASLAVARAKEGIATRGLDLTVIQDYYAVASAVRRLDNVQTGLRQARQFLQITQDQERGGEAAHADTIKAQIQVQQRQRDVEDARLNVDKAKIALSILIFPSLQQNYEIIDDLQQIAMLPTLQEATGQATATSPTLGAARASVTEAKLGVTVAKYAYLPSLGLDFFYGIDANQFAINSALTQSSGRSTQPNYLVENRRNLGYSGAVTLNIPIWTWGSTHSKVKQASLREQQAELDLTTTRKQLQADLASSHAEAETALSQIQTLRTSEELSEESLRLTLLRYKSGEATALEVVDAQTTAAQARTAYDDGLVRYRLALATLQSLTGTH
jgi:outer membrane protein TolC